MVSLLQGISLSLLDIAGQFRAKGIGLSASARALTNQSLSESTNGLNTILSLGTVSSQTGSDQQIMAIRASLPKSAISEFARDPTTDDGLVGPADTGQTVDTQA